MPADAARVFDWEGPTNFFESVLATESTGSLERFYDILDRPLRNGLGETIVERADQLLLGARTLLLAPIVTEIGTLPPDDTPVWTGSSSAAQPPGTCADWSDPFALGAIGRTGAPSGGWLQDGLLDCDFGARLYSMGVLPMPLPGDYNADEIVSGADFLTWQRNLGTLQVTPNDTSPAGNVSQADLQVWHDSFGTQTTITVLNVPSDDVPRVIGTNTQVNLLAGGVLPQVTVGWQHLANEHVELNVTGGELGEAAVNQNATANVSAGTFDSLVANAVLCLLWLFLQPCFELRAGPATRVQHCRCDASQKRGTRGCLRPGRGEGKELKWVAADLGDLERINVSCHRTLSYNTLYVHSPLPLFPPVPFI